MKTFWAEIHSFASREHGHDGIIRYCTLARSCFPQLVNVNYLTYPKKDLYQWTPIHDDDKTRCSVEVCLPSAWGLNLTESYLRIPAAQPFRHEWFTQLRGV
jgi:hypothetical protein